MRGGAKPPPPYKSCARSSLITVHGKKVFLRILCKTNVKHNLQFRNIKLYSLLTPCQIFLIIKTILAQLLNQNMLFLQSSVLCPKLQYTTF